MGLATDQANALQFQQLATLRTDAYPFGNDDDLRWRGPTQSFAAWADSIGA